MADLPKSGTVSTKQRQIANMAKQMPGKALHSLSQHMDMEWMREAYRRTRKDGAEGVDGQSAEEFARDLEGNLRKLLDEAKSGTYRAPEVRRVYIPKSGGKGQRPIGIPTFSDKVLQRAVVMALEPVYEQDFMDFSYGFRPGRSPHGALSALQRVLWEMDGGVVLEVDISKFFDTLDHQKLQGILRQRVTDGVLVRLVGKWLNAGVLEGGVMTHPESGTPQGGVASPLLANIYLHEVLDVWWVREVMPRLRGKAALIRYADDFVCVFQRDEDARRVHDVLGQRFARYGLTLHPEKTRMVPFRCPRRRKSPKGTDDDPKPGSFDFLGLTHYWGKARDGRWIPKQKTAKSRFSQKVREIGQWCRKMMHRPVAEQAKELGAKLRGHYQYYGITGNSKSLEPTVPVNVGELGPGLEVAWLTPAGSS
jgi:group II intron reverse transcriptase/maturase